MGLSRGKHQRIHARTASISSDDDSSGCEEIDWYGESLFEVAIDPFCGTGTSLVEGALADFSVCGTDLNPLARLISNVKTRDYDMDALQQSENRLQNMLKDLSEVEISQSFNHLLEEDREKWNSWFSEETLLEIVQLT